MQLLLYITVAPLPVVQLVVVVTVTGDRDW